MLSLQVDRDNQITSFAEKPKTKQEATMMSMDWDDLGSFLEAGATELLATSHHSSDSRAYIASCGMVSFFAWRYGFN